MNKQKLGWRSWSSIVLFGLFGQIAWVIENMYFNKFLYYEIAPNSSAIAWMVAASAATATLTTMFMGALSDKIGKRKLFITIGYILWGIVTLSFGFISLDAIENILPGATAITIGITIVIIMDCIMTFFGSTANDGAFNAWITDITNKDNRGPIEGVLASLPLIALLIVFGGFDSLSTGGQWPIFFFVLGGLISLGGILGLFMIKESQVVKSGEKYWPTFFYGFKPKSFKRHIHLYTTLITIGIMGISMQIWYPYFIVYFTEYLGILDYALLMGSIVLGASIVVMIVSRFMKESNKNWFFIPGIIMFIGGSLGLFFVRTILMVGIFGFIMMSGNLLLSSLLNAKVRDYTPSGKAGHFQGIRMIFFVLIPMIIGPFIGSQVIMSTGRTYNDFGVIKDVPTPHIFLAAGIASLLVIIPWLLLIMFEKRTKKQIESTTD